MLSHAGPQLLQLTLEIVTDVQRGCADCYQGAVQTLEAFYRLHR